MVSVALSRPTPSRHDAARWPRPVPIPHSPESMDGIPFYDDEFAMAQSIAHIQTILYLAPLLNRVAQAADLRWVSDNPVWYWIAEERAQRALYPDYALTANPSVAALTANDLLLVLEVVSTAKADKERKDTVRMRDYNEAHGVLEFVLLYPEPDDMRSVVWYRLDDARGRYREVPLPADGRYRSAAIPGLELEVLPSVEWTPGRKARVWFYGEELRDGETEARFRASAEQQAAQAAQQAAQERAEKEQERAEKERLLALLKQAGIDPGM